MFGEFVAGAKAGEFYFDLFSGGRGGGAVVADHFLGEVDGSRLCWAEFSGTRMEEDSSSAAAERIRLTACRSGRKYALASGCGADAVAARRC